VIDNAISGEAKITLQLYGNSLQQLFENVAIELLKTLIHPDEVGETLREKVVIEASDTSGLLKEWVAMLIRLAAQQNILYKKSRFQVFEAERTGPGKLRAEITGEFIDPQRHSFRADLGSLRCDKV
jgi:SHS2 domain-containing protein